MMRLLRERLALKLALLTGLTVAIGFAFAAAASARIQAETMDRLHAEGASDVARTLAAGVRNSMLNGNGITVRALLDDAQAGLQTARVRVFATSGEEVFGAKPPAPPPEAQPPHVRAVLRSREPAPAGDARAVPIENEKRCRSCHDEGPLRGVLTLGTKGAKVAVDGSDASLDALARIFRAAFVQIMTAKREDKLDDYFADVARHAPGVRGIAVYTGDAQRYYGAVNVGVPDEAVSRAALPHAQSVTVARGDLRYRVVPLPSEPRCKGCHKDAGEEVRGALVVAFAPGELEREGTLLEASETSLRHVMLSGLGRMVKGFLDDVAATGTVTALTVHDPDGRLYKDAFERPVAPPSVGAALSSGAPFVVPSTVAHPEYLFVEPLKNDKACQTCHGLDQPLRGAIEVRLDTSQAVSQIVALRRRSTAYGAATVLMVMALLFLVLHFTVLRPVREIGLVAEQVGAGRFDAKVLVSSGDEIGRLGTRVNDMVAGLRQKLSLARFVSQETLRSVEQEGGTVARGAGERRRVTMLFSDVRGFTAFSETRQPEEVVDMLNHYLQAQADVVIKYGGDIDKFVGDELMARFVGTDAEGRAVRCGVEMIEAVRALNESGPESARGINVGVGVNVGDVVLGAMGAEHRLDFTVIGDAVNLAARLCSSAKPGEVLLAQPVRDSMGDLDGIRLVALEPIRVKGKQEPVAIYRAERA